MTRPAGGKCLRASRNQAYRYCAALETINGCGSGKENEFSVRLAELMEMPGTAGFPATPCARPHTCATLVDIVWAVRYYRISV